MVDVYNSEDHHGNTIDTNEVLKILKSVLRILNGEDSDDDKVTLENGKKR